MTYCHIDHVFFFNGKQYPPGYYHSDNLPWSIVVKATRIWEQDDLLGIRYLKSGNTHYGDRVVSEELVNMEEFLWVKLQAKSIG